MNPKTILLLVFILCFGKEAFTQGFIFNQLFQPSVRLNSSYQHDFGWTGSHQLQYGNINVNCILPIKSKLALDVDWKKVFSLKFKKAARIKCYQIFLNFRPGIQYLNLESYPHSLHPFGGKPRYTYGAALGLTGVHLFLKKIKKPRILFYNLNVSIYEDQYSIKNSFVPAFKCIVGMAHIKSFKFFWYYGLFFSYDNAQIIPAPFFGIQAKLSKNIWFNMTLPVQIKFLFKLSKKVKFDIGASISGFSSPFGYQAANTIERYVIGGFRFRTGFNLNFKLNSRTTLYLESGFIPYQQINFRWNAPPFEPINGGMPLYFGISLYNTFRQSLLGKTIDGIIIF